MRENMVDPKIVINFFPFPVVYRRLQRCVDIITLYRNLYLHDSFIYRIMTSIVYELSLIYQS